MRPWPDPSQDIDSQLNTRLLSRLTGQAQRNSVRLSPHLPGSSFSVSSATAQRQLPSGCTTHNLMHLLACIKCSLVPRLPCHHDSSLHGSPSASPSQALCSCPPFAVTGRNGLWRPHLPSSALTSRQLNPNALHQSTRLTETSSHPPLSTGGGGFPGSLAAPSLSIGLQGTPMCHKHSL